MASDQHACIQTGRGAQIAGLHQMTEGEQLQLPGLMLMELMNHPAVTKHGQGVSSLELHDFISDLAAIAAGRVVSVGHEQYATEQLQKFETMRADDLGDGLIEEIADVFNYMAMILIKYLSLLRRLDNRIATSA